MTALMHHLVRIEWRTYGHHIQRSQPVRVLDVGTNPRAYDDACEAACAFRANAPRTTWAGSEWMHEQYMRELAAERRADARDEARDYRRRTWREKSFQIE